MPHLTRRALIFGSRSTPVAPRTPSSVFAPFLASAHAPAGVWAQRRGHGVRVEARTPCGPRRAAIRRGAPSWRPGSLGLACSRRLQGALAQEALGSARRAAAPWAGQRWVCHAHARLCARARAPEATPALLQAPAPRSARSSCRGSLTTPLRAALSRRCVVVGRTLPGSVLCGGRARGRARDGARDGSTLRGVASRCRV